MNHKRVERLWRQEGLRVPQRQPKRRRLWLGDGSIVRRRAEHRDHVWSYDFVFDRTADGRPLRLLPIVDEYTRESLSIDIGRRLNSEHVLARLAELFVRRGVPAYIRSDNGPEFTAKAVRRWLPRVGVQTLFIEPGSPWENGYVESFNGKLRDEHLNVELFDTLLEAQVLTERWRCEYNQLRPHSSLGYRPPAPEATPQPLTPGRLAPVPVLTCSNLGSGTNGGGRSVPFQGVRSCASDPCYRGSGSLWHVEARLSVAGDRGVASVWRGARRGRHDAASAGESTKGLRR